MARTAALAVAAASASLASCARAPGDTRPNFVLYFPDEVRAESLGSYGHPLTKTPGFDALAASGALFEQAHVQHTQCSPSRCALFTGRYMHVLGHRTQDHLLQSWEENMFRYLKQAGYTTLLLGKNDVLSSDSFNSSLTFWQNELGVGTGSNPYPYGTAGYFSFLATGGTASGNSSVNADLKAIQDAGAFFAHSPPEPFLLFIAGIGAHPPYGAPSDYQHMYDPAAIKAAAPLRPMDTPSKPGYIGPAGIRAYRNLTGFGDDFAYTINAIYLGRVTYVDYLLSTLVGSLDAAQGGVGNRTVVIVTSDHGDFAGDYGIVEKYPGAADDILTRVPLLIRAPGGVPGLRVAAPVASFDVMATILDLANVTMNHTQFALPLTPLLFGNSSARMHEYVFSEGGYTPNTNEPEPLDPAQAAQYADPTNSYYPRGQEELLTADCTRFVMMRNASHKLVYRPLAVSELYDLVADPRELNNVFGNAAYAPVQAAMLEDMLSWLVQTSDVTPNIYDARNEPVSPPYPYGPWPPVAAAAAAEPAHAHIRGAAAR